MAPPPSPPRKPEPMSDAKPLVLVIEDEAPIRRFLRASLPLHDFRLVERPPRPTACGCSPSSARRS